MKMEPIRSSETSAIKTQTPGNYPKSNILQLKHDESFENYINIYYFSTAKMVTRTRLDIALYVVCLFSVRTAPV